MGWHEVMGDLETKLIGTLRRIYRPLDNVPFFRVQYPPSEEREAIREFKLLAERLRQQGYKVECISLTEVLKQALEYLLNCSSSNLAEQLKSLEQDRDRPELQEQLSKHLPEKIATVLRERLNRMSQESVAILLRMGTLYPFIRSSSLESRLEGQVPCAVVLPYPGITLGSLLDARPADPHGGYYRGEIIDWR